MDIQKAYGSVKWGALDEILRELGFLDQFLKWTMMRITTVSYRYSSCGKQTKILVARNGLRQGDHMSPLLPVLIMKYLNKYLKKLRHKPNFNFHPKYKKLSITNICIAEDLILFSIGDKESLELFWVRCLMRLSS